MTEHRIRRKVAASLTAIWMTAPAMVIGKFNPRGAEVNTAAVAREGLPWSTLHKRRNVFIEPGNTITYSLYAPLDFTQSIGV